jgi:hypothetical protein
MFGDFKMSKITLRLNDYSATEADDARAIKNLLDHNKDLSLISYYLWGNHMALLFDYKVSWADIVDWQDTMSSAFADNGAGFKMHGFRADDIEWRTL